MSVNASHPADITLCGFVSLENRRAVADKPLSFIYDALFSYGSPPQIGLGSFRHFVGQDKNKKRDHCYEINAKVIAFKPGRNTQSPQYNDDEVRLLGEIRKMQPLYLPEDEDVDETIQISGSGTVTSADKKNASFVIHGTQYTHGGDSSDDVIIRARMDQNPKWSNPAKRVPEAHTVMHFSGNLVAFESYSATVKTATTCLVVALDEITYLHSAPSKTSTKEEGKPKKMEGNLRAKLRARTKPSENSPSTSSPVVSEVQLGKRKERESEEEVNENV